LGRGSASVATLAQTLKEGPPAARKKALQKLAPNGGRDIWCPEWYRTQARSTSDRAASIPSLALRACVNRQGLHISPFPPFGARPTTMPTS